MPADSVAHRRFLRRLAERKGRAHPPEAGLRFGAADPRNPDDRRQAERRTEDLSGDDLTARLQQLGITDRRRGQRRQGDRRR
jgi:hypothetical protein